MVRPRRSDAALPLLAAGAAAALLGPSLLRRWPDFVFGALLFTVVLVLVRASWRTYRAAGRASAHARAVDRMEPTAVAAAAVRTERARMAAEIDATVRSSLETICRRIEAVEDGADPVTGLRAVQLEAQRAMTELRRELGLLHEHPARATVHATAPGPVPPARPSRADVLVTVGTMAGAVVESLVWDRLASGGEWPTPSLGLSLGLYLGLLALRVAPEVAATWMTVLLALSVLAGIPVSEGFAFAVAYNLVLWRLAVLRPRPVRVVSLLGLATAVVGSRLVHSPDNALINVVLIAVVVLTGELVGVSRRAAVRAHRAAVERETYLHEVSDEAVRAERHVVAGELHDVASHAISLIAVLAGAAEVLWSGRSPEAAGATRQVRVTARHALGELDGLSPGAVALPVDWEAVEGMVQRMRAAGLEVTATWDGTVPAAVVPTVYRIVQEALTNALRHAPGAPVEVVVHSSRAGVDVVVRNPCVRADDARRGFGLVGLQERVAHAGGTVAVGPDGAGRFSVRAHLPVAQEVEA